MYSCHCEADIKGSLARIEARAREGQRCVEQGDVAAAATCFEAGLGLAQSLCPQAREAVLGLPSGAAIWAGLSKQTRSLQLRLLLSLAACRLQTHPPDSSGALSACEEALRLEPTCAMVVALREKAMAGLRPPAQAAAEEVSMPEEGRATLPYASPATTEVPINFTGERGRRLNFPAPLAVLGLQAIDYMAAKIAQKVEQHGTAVYHARLIQAVERGVDAQFGRGARDRIARLLPCLRMVGCEGGLNEYEPGNGHRSLTSYMAGLSPNLPFHEARDYPWCTRLQEHASEILQELRDKAKVASWQDMGDSVGLSAEWRSLTLMKHGLWADRGHFPRTEAVFRGLPEVRPMELFFARMPPHTEILPHSDETNFLLTSHLGLELEEGTCTLTVGEHSRAWQKGASMVFDHSYIHSASNASDKDRDVLICRFWHPGCSEEEAVGLCLMSALLECILRHGRVRAVFAKEQQEQEGGGE